MPQATERNETIEVNNVSRFISLVLELPIDDKHHKRFYRGHADKNWELKPGIYRSNAEKRSSSGRPRIVNPNYYKAEHNMFRELVAHYSDEFSSCRSAIDFLVKMQHYGLRTRLLDITTNPLVALYFACSEQGKKDGEVIVFDVPNKDIKHYESDTISILANLAKCDKIDISLYSPKYSVEFHTDLKIKNPKGRQHGGKPSTQMVNQIKKELAKGKKNDERTDGYITTFNQNTQIKLLLHQIRSEKPHFEPLIDPYDIGKVWASMVKLNNPRIINQSGAFFISGLGLENREDNLYLTKQSSPDIPDDWVKRNKKIVVPASKKPLIIKELKALGITKSFLFPEIDVYAEELKEKYK